MFIEKDTSHKNNSSANATAVGAAAGSNTLQRKSFEAAPQSLQIPDGNFMATAQSAGGNVIQRQEKRGDETKKEEEKSKFHLQLTEPDFLSMRKPFLNRGVPHLWDPSSALGVWNFNFRFFKNFGVADGLAGKAANLTAPFFIDNQLKADNPTWWEITDKQLNQR